MSAAEILKSMKGAPKLDKSTYNRWSTHFIDVLSLFEIDDYVLTQKVELENFDGKDVAKSKLIIKQDKNIRIVISQLVPDIAFHLVDQSYTSKKCWDNLKQFYRPNSDEDADDLLQEFWGLNFDDDVDVDDLVQTLSEIRAKIFLIASSSCPSDSSMKKRILNHFIKCCGGFYMATVISLRDSTISLDSAVSSIRASQAVYRQLHPTPTVALANEIDDAQEHDDSKSFKSCAHCKRRGHLRESCFLWLDTPDGSKWAAKNPEKAARTRKLKAKLANRKGKEKSSVNHLSDHDEAPESGIWVMEEHALLAPNGRINSNIVLDTGATNHVFHDKSMFFSISPSNKTVVNASGQHIPVSGTGRVQFRVFDYQNKNSSKIITMENVLFVPSCTKNLVSGIQLISKGYGIKSLNGGLSVLSRDGSVIATARPEGGLFCFNTTSSRYIAPQPKPLSQSETLISHDINSSAVELLHQRFAHVGSHILKKINLSELKISGLKPNAKQFRANKEILQSCEICNSCKQVEKINRGPITRSNGILDLIHSDTWGKCRVPGIYGSHYFVTFTDDYTRESDVYLMKSKTEVPNCFRLYKSKKERQSGRTIKAMRFDGGSEYKTIDFDGIIQQISAPYTQHQNGVAERLNRSLITMARCMLAQANLPSRFWDAAVLTACYLRNRLPFREDNLTSFEAMNGCSPVIYHLKVWGCICYALIDDKDPQRSKLSPTSHRGIFVGYCESTTQYRIYVNAKPGAEKVITSANVRFIEDSFWDWNTSSSSNFDRIEMPISANQNFAESESDSEEDSNSEMDITPSNDFPHIPQEPVESLDPEDINENTSDTPEPIPEVESQPLRRSNRPHKPIPPRSAWTPRSHALHVGKEISIPQSYSEAISGPDKEQWKVAISDELDSLRDKEVFTSISHIPQGRRPVGSRWVFAIKSDGRFKARLVAQGFSQIPGIDYFNTYAPTLRMDSLRILLAVSAFRDWEIHQVDVKTAYLEGDLHEEIFMKRPEGMLGTKFVKVKKALYGLKQSGRAWNEKLVMRLSSLEFKKSEYDHCIYIHPKFQLVIGVYVDDLIICGKIIEQVIEVKEKLSSYFPIKDLGSIDTIIGWKVVRERATRTLSISQAGYLLEKLKSFGLENAKTCISPMDGYDGALPGRDGEEFADESAYASAIGSLGYASNSTRPDISFAISQLSSFNSCPVVRHWNSVCRILRYIKGSKDYCITYSFGPTSDILTQELKAISYSDSDFASDITTRRSVSGFILMLGGGPVCWQTRRQKSISTSTAEAEYVALFEASKQIVWATGFLNELHVANMLIDDKGMLTYTDNQSALAIANGANSAKAKHIDVAYHFVRKCIQDGKMDINPSRKQSRYTSKYSKADNKIR